MLDEHSRHIAQLDGLACKREGAGDHGLRGNDGRQGSQSDHGQQGPLGGQQVERVAHRSRVVEDQRTLAEVVQHQARQHKHEPSAGNRLATEVPHVGV
ncbi:hypothetical protein D3C81_1325270 [compost metagenome]